MDIYSEGTIVCIYMGRNVSGAHRVSRATDTESACRAVPQAALTVAAGTSST